MQRRYVLRTLLACLSYLIGCVIAELALAVGLIETEPVRWYEAASVAVAGVSFVAVRSGYTRRWADPAMTVWQMLVAETLATAAYVLFYKFRGALIALQVAVVFFGTFSLTRLRQWLVGLYALVLMAIAMTWKIQTDSARFPPEVEAVHFLVLFTLQPIVAVLGAQFGEMRRRLHSRQRALEDALLRIQELANRDSLTGLANRRHAQEWLDHHSALQTRSGRALSLVLMDLDHFKTVNDTHGHGVGDQVLRGFAQLAQKHVRECDILARWGGEEFLLVMPDTDLDGALQLVERLRLTLRDTPVSADVPALRVKFSAGLTEHQPDECVGMTLSRADQALYEAKLAGRSRSVTRFVST